jgi:hypothetical protein
MICMQWKQLKWMMLLGGSCCRRGGGGQVEELSREGAVGDTEYGTRLVVMVGLTFKDWYFHQLRCFIVHSSG